MRERVFYLGGVNEGGRRRLTPVRGSLGSWRGMDPHQRHSWIPTQSGSLLYATPSEVSRAAAQRRRLIFGI